MKRSPISRRTEPSEFEKEFQEMKPVVHERSGGWCEMRLPAVCDGRAQHVHHRRTRKRGGDNSLINLLDACFNCHNWTHDHPLQAEELGFLLPSAW